MIKPAAFAQLIADISELPIQIKILERQFSDDYSHLSYGDWSFVIKAYKTFIRFEYKNPIGHVVPVVLYFSKPLYTPQETAAYIANHFREMVEKPWLHVMPHLNAGERCLYGIHMLGSYYHENFLQVYSEMLPLQGPEYLEKMYLAAIDMRYRFRDDLRRLYDNVRIAKSLI